MSEQCPKRWQNSCPLRASKVGCFLIEHHMAYPAADYQTELEQEFRELSTNKVKMCRFVEQGIHKAQPKGPPKATVEVMEYCVAQEKANRQLRTARP